MTLSFSFLDFYDTTGEKLLVAGHVPGPKCCCKECNNLKDLEDRWILKMGSFYGISGLNSRDEIKNKTRCTWKWTSNFKSSICFLLLNVPIFSNRYWNFSLLFSFCTIVPSKCDLDEGLLSEILSKRKWLNFALFEKIVMFLLI